MFRNQFIKKEKKFFLTALWFLRCDLLLFNYLLHINLQEEIVVKIVTFLDFWQTVITYNF